MANTLIAALTLLFILGASEAFAIPPGCFRIQEDIEQLEEQAVRDAVAIVSRSVVQIETIGGIAKRGDEVSPGPCTGTIIDDEGLIMTASYNLRHDPSSIFVNIPVDGAETPLRLVAKKLAEDSNLNLTLLQVSTKDLPPNSIFPPAEFADRQSVSVGETSIGVGKVYSASESNVSVGIVSAMGRVWNKAIQTDAKISQNNYGGPLINLRGKVIGILVPLSPDAADLTAGGEWYDSGIGFAAIFDPKSDAVEKMKTGTLVRKGLLGVKLAGNDQFVDRPIVAYVPPKSPASEAGLIPDDVIISVDGHSVSNHANFKHALGPKYESETVTIGVERTMDDSSVESKSFLVTLAGQIDPFIEPSIGVLFDRSHEENELIVERWTSSPPVNDQGLQSGDKVESIAGQPVRSITEFRDALNREEIGGEIQLEILRDDRPTKVTATTFRTSANPVVDLQPRAIGKKVTSVKIVELKVAESSNKCFAIIPETKLADANVANQRGLFVWVPPPGPVDRKSIKKQWSELSKQWNTIVVVPESASPQSWSPDEAAVIDTAIAKLKKQTPFDDLRVAIGGIGPGGMMAAFASLKFRSRFRGLALHDAVLPQGLPNMDSLPTQRLHFLFSASEKFESRDESIAAAESLKELGFAVGLGARQSGNGNGNGLDDAGVTANLDWPEIVIGWVHTLDRQ